LVGLEFLLLYEFKMKQVFIYTDGACRGNPGPGGWGAILRYYHHEKILSGAELHTTNNRMELLAAINALTALTQPCKVQIWTDSQYVQKGVTQWMPVWKQRDWRNARKKSIKNLDLWQRLEEAMLPHQVKWHWIKGHSGHPENERADHLANLAID